MIAYLSGKLIHKQAPIIILDVNGVGYELWVPMSTYYDLPEVNHNKNLYCYQYVREDINLLYGFNDLNERKLFVELIKTNGVGPRLALTILSSFQVAEFISIVDQCDAASLIKLPGVGKKTAERLLLELKDRLNKAFKDNIKSTSSSLDLNNLEPDASISNINQQSGVQNNIGVIVADAISALESLGYKYNDANKVISKLSRNNEFNTSCENLIKAALKEFR